MITLLMALFMVLFSISSVNISKYQVLQQSLKAAFSGSILPGGRAILQSGSESTSAHTPATAEVPSIVPLIPTPNVAASSSTGSADSSQPGRQAAERRPQLQAALNSRARRSPSRTFDALKQKLDAYARRTASRTRSRP